MIATDLINIGNTGVRNEDIFLSDYIFLLVKNRVINNFYIISELEGTLEVINSMGTVFQRNLAVRQLDNCM